ncbi:hypothetical protein A3D69_02310 [Candidatus Uhrbacteria bacterium RIFCSPHIGHO2_02_FULL_54_11]|nr:MAG: hypothetical protein A3D69_02310 [Candidatus Uhrbacteria bacterium RIFCSPHIGHO2_02_FULL_54_11]
MIDNDCPFFKNGELSQRCVMTKRSFTINGSPSSFDVPDGRTLLELLREDAGLTGTKQGCDMGTCGSCTVLRDGQPILACLTLVASVEGREIVTVEGLAEQCPKGQALQEAFGKCGAAQCGACTPGMLMSSSALLLRAPEPSRVEIAEALAGNLCRCTGYGPIFDAVEVASGTREPPENPIVNIRAPEMSDGSAVYGDDLHLSGTLVGKILRSPHAHARILSIDTSVALTLPGVRAVVTIADFKKGEDGRAIRYGIIPWAGDETALAEGEVVFVGQEVVAVAADDEATALTALNLIVVEYEVLPHVVDALQALKPGAPLVHTLDPRKGCPLRNNVFKEVILPDFGDVDGAFARSDVVIEEDTFVYPGSNHVAIETHSATAFWDKDGLRLFSSTQVPHYLRLTAGLVMGEPIERVRVTQTKTGGGFGGKSDIGPFEMIVCLLSKLAGAPVKITLTREEVFYLHRGRHTTVIKMRIAVDHEGNVVGVESDVVLDGGAFASFGPITPYYLLQLLGGPVKIGAYRARSVRVYTNKPPQGPKRGHGTPQPRFAFEMLLDRASRRLGIDPMEIRRQGAIASGEFTVNGFPVPSSGILECLKKVEQASSWHLRDRLPPGYGLGVAVGMYISGTAGAIHGSDDDDQSNVAIRMEADGTLVVSTQASEIGQGIDTMLAVLASDVTEVPRDRIRVITGDTALGPKDLGAYSSRGTIMLGTACVRAGEAFVKARTSGEELPNVTGTFMTITPERDPRVEGYRGDMIGASPTYSMTAYVALVHVDGETGVVTVKKIWVAHDCGRAVNPDAVHGQVQGCASMADSEARFECLTYDEEMGLPHQPHLLGHLITTALDAPNVVSFIVETEDHMSPHGAKEAGEGPLLPGPPAIGNAILAAIGTAPTELPFTPERVLEALDRLNKEGR